MAMGSSTVFSFSLRAGRLGAALAVLALLWALSLASAAPASAGARACPSVNATPTQVAQNELVRSTLCLINAQRARHRVAPLRMSGQLSAAAQGHAQDMERRNYFSHNSQTGATFVDRIRRAGYLRRASYWTIGENLAWGAGINRSTPLSIVAAWMNSAPHKANMLSSRYTEIGIGVAIGAPRGHVRSSLPAATYATDFGARR